MDYGAKCDKCPLKKARVTAPEKVDNPKLVVLGESPGKVEVVTGTPFAAQSGVLLGDSTDTHGLERGKNVELNNTVLCRPLPHMSNAQWSRAIECCRPRLAHDLEKIPPNTTVVTLGGRSIETIMEPHKKKGKVSVKAWRGYPIEKVRKELPQNLNYFPTYHPAKVLRDLHYMPQYTLDWDRAGKINGLKKEEWQALRQRWGTRYVVMYDQAYRFDDHEDPEMVAVPVSTSEVWQALEKIGQAENVGVDVENGGSTHPLLDPLIDIGVGTWDDEELGLAVSVQWPPKGEVTKVEGALRAVLAGPARKILQNMNHDRLTCEANGIELNGPWGDSLPAGCVLASKVDHDLGTMDNWYYFAPRYKTQFHAGDDRKGAKAFVNAPFLELGDYNCKDNIACPRVWLRQMEEMDDRERRLYDESMELQDLAFKMTKRGVRIDDERAAKMYDELVRNARNTAACFLKRVRRSKEIRQKTLSTFWQHGRGKYWLNKQKDGPKQLFYEVLGIEPKHFSKQTGQPSLSKNAKRDLIGMKDPLVSDLASYHFAFDEWNKLAQMVKSLREASINNTLHVMWSAGLKVTRRWGSSPNLQNLPKAKFHEGRELPSLRSIIRARPGMFLVEADYSQQELRAIALATQDPLLIRWYNEGRNLHDMNTRSLFGIEKNHPRWKELRTLAKNFIFGLYYGADPHTNWLNLVPMFPNLEESLIEHLYEKWFEQHPMAKEWHAKQFYEGRKQGYTQALFSGHRFYHYYGKVKPTICYNFPIQEEGGRQLNRSVLELDKLLDHERGEHIIMTVHDAIITEGPDPFRLAWLMKDVMETTVTMGDYTMDFPIEAEWGQNWGHMEPIHFDKEQGFIIAPQLNVTYPEASHETTRAHAL